MSRFEKNFDDYSWVSDWYSHAAGMEFYATWGDLPLFKAEVNHLAFMRIQTCWLEATLHDMWSRRRSVEALARSVLSPTDVPDDELKKWWSLFGVESVSPKLADSICTLYNEPPYRTFSPNDGMQKAFLELYDTFEVNLMMKDAYRSSLFVNVIALLPDWDSKKIRVLTPDYFRLVVDENNIPIEIWIAKGYGGYANTEFEVWSADTFKVVNHDGKLKTSTKNPYGRIPGVILKLNRSNDIYGSGITESAELSAWSNFIRLISTRVAVFQSYSVGIGVNLDLKPGTRIGPGFILNQAQKVGDGVPPPSFTYVNPEAYFVELEKYRQDCIHNFERNQGLPGFLVDEGAGQPPTGAALQVLERALDEKRKEHTHALIKAEKDLVALISLMAEIDGHREIKADAFGVQYSDIETFNDAGDELDFDIVKMGQGLTSPSILVLKYFNKRMPDEEAAAFLETNKKFFPNAVTPEISTQKIPV